ncbi:DUF3298 and DUF4163 domain-containing protein [Anaeromicropila herbilytica]|uniref:Anti-sigma-V factor RsiV n=1 Tax=Anaeromicropila herbilytica TaxID=2785025 RepID=A0A7R7EGQ6_9FIRM|nr:DUF3298 and DUF4163 domain-containing protein [Anaeromicropila herbilytica]BCN28885.1 anti-sigma-V factor RsiV [Anaeromicropila herbilytica]
MNKIAESKKLYNSIEIPKQLNSVVESAIERAMKQKKSKTVVIKPMLYAAASVSILFVAGVNSNQAFAESVYKVPVLGSIAKVVTFREYEEEKEGYHLKINAPAIEGIENKALEKRINTEIQAKMDAVMKHAREREEENKKMLLKEGKSEKELSYFTINVDYEIKNSSDRILSFVINDTESFANTYTYQTYYNINLDTGKEITITDALGADYKKVIADSIKEQIKERVKEHPDYMYYDFDENAKYYFEDLKFYMKENGNVVISFDKGEIAPPPMGLQEFEITK